VSYRAQFDQYLHDKIRAGGDVDRICVFAIGFLGHEEAVRGGLFRDWASSHVFVCEGCLEDFRPEAGGLNEDDEVHCAQCVAWGRGYKHGLRAVGGERR
jgi:hypothetical protein